MSGDKIPDLDSSGKFVTPSSGNKEKIYNVWVNSHTINDEPLSYKEAVVLYKACKSEYRDSMVEFGKGEWWESYNE